MRFIYLILVLCPCFLQAQYEDEIFVSKQLIKAGEFEDAFKYLSIENRFKRNSELNFLFAKASFYSKEFEIACNQFKALRTSEPKEVISYYHFLSELYYDRIDSTNSINLNPNNAISGLFFMGRDILIDKYDSIAYSSLNDETFLLKKHYRDLHKVYLENKLIKRKSPVLASYLSVILPGSGKVYAGKLGEGVASFLITGILIGSSIEQFNNGGFNNPQFYLLGLPALFFYFGNIYGAYFSVNITNIENHEKLKNEVLFNLHIPFKSIYNQ